MMIVWPITLIDMIPPENTTSRVSIKSRCRINDALPHCSPHFAKVVHAFEEGNSRALPIKGQPLESNFACEHRRFSRKGIRLYGTFGTRWERKTRLATEHLVEENGRKTEEASVKQTNGTHSWSAAGERREEEIEKSAVRRGLCGHIWGTRRRLTRGLLDGAKHRVHVPSTC